MLSVHSIFSRTAASDDVDDEDMVKADIQARIDKWRGHVKESSESLGYRKAAQKNDPRKMAGQLAIKTAKVARRTNSAALTMLSKSLLRASRAKTATVAAKMLIALGVEKSPVDRNRPVMSLPDNSRKADASLVENAKEFIETYASRQGTTEDKILGTLQDPRVFQGWTHSLEQHGLPVDPNTAQQSWNTAIQEIKTNIDSSGARQTPGYTGQDSMSLDDMPTASRRARTDSSYWQRMAESDAPKQEVVELGQAKKLKKPTSLLRLAEKCIEALSPKHPRDIDQKDVVGFIAHLTDGDRTSSKVIAAILDQIQALVSPNRYEERDEKKDKEEKKDKKSSILMQEDDAGLGLPAVTRNGPPRQKRRKYQVDADLKAVLGSRRKTKTARVACSSCEGSGRSSHGTCGYCDGKGQSHREIPSILSRWAGQVVVSESLPKSILSKLQQVAGEKRIACGCGGSTLPQTPQITVILQEQDIPVLSLMTEDVDSHSDQDILVASFHKKLKQSLRQTSRKVGR